MTVVRDFTGAPAAIKTLIGSCDVTDDQSWVVYLKLGEAGSQWFVARHNASFANAQNWMSLGYEGNELLFYPGAKGSGESLPEETWILVAGTNDPAGGPCHFYAYDLEEEKLLFVEEGGGGVPVHTEVAARLQFGRWNNAEQFIGLYAAAAVYNAALTEADFLALAGASSVEAWLGLGSPVGLWVFDQESGEETLDLTGNGANGSFAIQDGFASKKVAVPLALREGEEEGEEEGGGVLVKSGGVLVEGKRYVKQGGILVPV